MASDTGLIARNISAFYNFSDKTVIGVGIGGGSLLEAIAPARKIFAVDMDKNAIAQLKEKAGRIGISDKIKSVERDFFDVGALQGDVVYFEFSLHEIGKPLDALRLAKEWGGEILVVDHLPHSEWSNCAAETEKLTASWDAINSFTVKKREIFETTQFFKDYDELYNKLKSQGEEAVKRIYRFNGKADFTIPMPYSAVLI